MSTISNTQPGPARLALGLSAPAWRAILDRFAAAWVARRRARDDRNIDPYFRRERSEHERFLSRATDRYELERMEREWSRRTFDLWRVY